MFNFFKKKPVTVRDPRPFHETAQPLTAEEMKMDETRSLDIISDEFKRAFEFIRKFPRSVSFFGSARFTPENEHCKEAYKLSKRITSELGYAIVTGGGPGIMEAANKGCSDANGESLGLSIHLPREQLTNPHVKRSVNFNFFFTRKTALSFAAEAYIFFPGGFGTLDEFFEVLTLVQTKKIPKVPIILVGHDYWEPLQDFIYGNVYKLHGAISEADMKLYHLTDNHDEIIDIIKKTPVQNWWKDFEVQR